MFFVFIFSWIFFFLRLKSPKFESWTFIACDVKIRSIGLVYSSIHFSGIRWPLENPEDCDVTRRKIMVKCPVPFRFSLIFYFFIYLLMTKRLTSPAGLVRQSSKDFRLFVSIESPKCICLLTWSLPQSPEGFQVLYIIQSKISESK